MSSLSKLRRFVREYNDFLHNDEKRVEAATSAWQALKGDIQQAKAQWEGIADKTFAKGVALAKAMDALRAAHGEALGLATVAVADLEAIAARYAPLSQEVRERATEPKIAPLAAHLEDILEERAELAVAAVDIKGKLEGMV